LPDLRRLNALPPCSGYRYRVVVSYLGYGSTGIKGIITAYQERIPASAVPPRCG
jgi:hypothetical protein